MLGKCRRYSMGCTCPQSTLLPAAMEQIGQIEAVLHVKRADALGRTELVADQSQHVHSKVRNVERNLSVQSCR